MIAGETSLAYDEVVTISLVSTLNVMCNKRERVSCVMTTKSYKAMY